MHSLSSPIANMKIHDAAIVIGSGYGGAIAASRLARAGQQVCVLERGKEFQPGEYLNTGSEAVCEMQAHIPQGHLGSKTGLYKFHFGPDFNVFVGCGLGGTSLVNANVSLRSELRMFDDDRWSQALRNDRSILLEESYLCAEQMLKPTPYPKDFPILPSSADWPFQLLSFSVSETNSFCKLARSEPLSNCNKKTAVNYTAAT